MHAIRASCPGPYTARHTEQVPESYPAVLLGADVLVRAHAELGSLVLVQPLAGVVQVLEILLGHCPEGRGRLLEGTGGRVYYYRRQQRQVKAKIDTGMSNVNGSTSRG